MTGPARCPACGQSSATAELERLQAELRALHQKHPVSEMGESAWNMTAQLHIAARGATWARPESPEQVWQGLLAEVMAMRASAAQPAEVCNCRCKRPKGKCGCCDESLNDWYAAMNDVP